MSPSPSGNAPRPNPDNPGPTLYGDRNLLNGASLHTTSPSMTSIMTRYAPAELTLEGVSLDDAARVINEVLLPDEDLPLDGEMLGRFLEQTTRGLTLDRSELGALAPEYGDLIVRQLLTLSGFRGIGDEASVEFSIEEPVTDGCAVTVARGSPPDTCRLTIDWGRQLDFQSSFSLSTRWELVQEVLIAVGEIDTASCRTAVIDSARRFQLEDRATIEVVARDSKTADPSNDPHLSQRSDIMPLCALRLYSEEVAVEHDIAVRYMQLLGHLSNLCPDLQTDVQQATAIVSRQELEQLGDDPFLWNASAEVRVINVEQYLLVVTKGSTGSTLLEDIQALERYARRSLNGEIQPKLHGLRSIQSAEATSEDLAKIFKEFSLPSDEHYFFGAMRDFVDQDDAAARKRIKDGLLDAINSKQPATVELARIFRVQGLKPLDFSEDDLIDDELEEESSDESQDEEDADGEASTEDDDAPFADPADRVTVSRTAYAIPSSGAELSLKPSVGFIPAEDTDFPGLFSSEGQPILSVAASSINVERSVLAPDLAEKILKSLGANPNRLSPLAIVTIPALGERRGYLSETVRVFY